MTKPVRFTITWKGAAHTGIATHGRVPMKDGNTWVASSMQIEGVGVGATSGDAINDLRKNLVGPCLRDKDGHMLPHDCGKVSIHGR